MKPLMTFIEMLAVSAVFTWILTDGWLVNTVLGNFVLIAAMTMILFAVYLYGVNHGIKIGQKERDILFNEGFQTGKHWRGK